MSGYAEATDHMYEQSRSAHDAEHTMEELIDRLESNVVSARSLPFSESCIVDREEMLVLITMIRDNLPGELKQARWLLEQNRQLIAEARKEAESIMREAETRMTMMIDEHEITQQARKQAEATVENANQAARQIRSGAMEYARQRLAEIEEQLTEMLLTVQRNKKELK
ncbi:MAG: ATPase [Saccharofermentanales bacterium]